MMAKVNTLEKLRPCGRWETWSTSKHDLETYTNVCCAVTYWNPAFQQPLKSIIYNALNAVIARHSILSAIPLHEDKSYPDVYFARLPSINLDQCVEFIEREHDVVDDERDQLLDRVLQEQHSRNFKEDLGTRPFWRLFILHQPSTPGKFTAGWVYHHALADGSSSLVFHQTFLSALQTAALEAPESPTVKPPNAPLLPPFEGLHPLGVSILFIVKTLLGSWFPRLFDPRPAKLWTGARSSAEPELLARKKVRSVVISSKDTLRLLEMSRKQRTTMTATLECIVTVALLKNLDPAKYDKIRANGPMSMRRFCKWDGGNLDNELINAVTEYVYLHKRSSPQPKFSWDDARGVRAEIVKVLDQKGYNNEVGLLRFVGNVHQFFNDHLGQERSNTVEVSNIGVFRDKDQEGGESAGTGKWKIGRCVFSQCPIVIGSAILCSVATGGDGCAVLAFSWYEGAVEEEFMERVFLDIEKEVKDLVHEDD